ncbi:MAG: glycosyltransferase family 9 protein [Deltaproteobacteria bacterium]|nr:MAG: glycosyltransferase family 9 protein [Deltaproteobacteria bacterium]
MNSLLIVHQGAIGDFVLSLPALEALHRWNLRARFTFLAYPKTAEIIRARPYVGNVYDVSRRSWTPLHQPEGGLAPADLESLPPVDLIFVFGRYSSQIVADNLAAHLGKSAHRIDPFPEPDLSLGISEYQCRQLEDLGILALPPPPAVIAPLRHDILAADAFVHQQLAPGERLVLLHPGSGGQEKLWAPAGWLSLIRKLISYPNLRLVLLQGPADVDIIQRLRSELTTKALTIVENWPLGRLAALIRHAALYLGNDSGITHLAAACSTPTIAIFGPTDPTIWAPRGPRVRIICWKPRDSGTGLPLGSQTICPPPPEAALVWQQASEWLRMENV